jgi:hypothetical protein
MRVKRFLIGLLIFVVFLGTLSLDILGNVQEADAYVSVKGYYRSDGTYVRPHVRSTPNALKYDNYSYKGGSLYNPSYFSSTRSYSSNWYTPSYLTDPYYYTGKSLYSSGSYYPSSLYSSPSYNFLNNYNWQY